LRLIVRRDQRRSLGTVLRLREFHTGEGPVDVVRTERATRWDVHKNAPDAMVCKTVTDRWEWYDADPSAGRSLVLTA
jgi:hypothetical protein